MEEYLQKLKVVDLRKLCTFYKISGLIRKREMVEALVQARLELDEIQEQLDEFEKEKQAEAERERAEADKKKEEQAEKQRQAEIESRREERAHELELARLRGGGSSSRTTDEIRSDSRDYDMSKYLRPFKEDGDLGLYLVNFERMCSEMGFPRDKWSLRLMTVLPPSASEVVARLGEDEALSYDVAKASLLRKYKLNADAYRKKFRNMNKTQDENYGDFAYKLKVNLNEWVKGEFVDRDYDKLIQVICLEQFYANIPDDMRFWVKDRNDVKTVERAAALADEYYLERGPPNDRYDRISFNSKNRHAGVKDQRKFDRPDSKESVHVDEGSDESKGAEQNQSVVNSTNGDQHIKKLLERKRPLRCYICQGPHYASQCNKPQTVFACVGQNNRARELLSPYIFEAEINGKKGNVLRDTAATCDVVSKSYIDQGNYTGKTVLLRIALSNRCVCLPVVNVTLVGPLGKINCEAAVTDNLPENISYLLSNDTWMRLQEKSESAMYSADFPNNSFKLSFTDENSANRDSCSVEYFCKYNNIGNNRNCNLSSDDKCISDISQMKVIDLIKLQNQDNSLSDYQKAARDNRKLNNTTFRLVQGLLCSENKRNDGTSIRQIVVPTPLRTDVVSIAHTNAHSRHLGSKGTIKRIKTKFWWPQIKRDVKFKIKQCDVCNFVREVPKVVSLYSK